MRERSAPVARLNRSVRERKRVRVTLARISAVQLLPHISLCLALPASFGLLGNEHSVCDILITVALHKTRSIQRVVERKVLTVLEY